VPQVAGIVLVVLGLLHCVNPDAFNVPMDLRADAHF
jgi:hypothetical protein